MTAILKLVHGSNSLNLIDDDKYCPSVDFIPPATSTTPALARGTVQSRYTGSSLVNQSANDSMLDFTIRCYGTTTGEAQARARKLQAFLSHAGDKITPLQLHYRESADIAAEPLWGEYGANKRYTIIHANTSLKESYSLAGVRAQVVEVVVSLLIAPYAEGLKMRLGTASGGIIEDILGTVDGRSRGLIIPEATTNKITNPVFGHSTWNNGWAAATLSDTENTNSDFLYPGAKSSAKLTAAIQDVFYVTLNVGNTNTHSFSAYVKKEDGSAVTSSDCWIYYGGSKTSTYTSLGDGVYIVSWVGAGIAAGTVTGLTVANSHSVYLMGYQCEEKAYRTPLAWGDLLGCAWTGTEHASTSTRTVASLYIPTDINQNEGSISIVWQPHYSSTTTTANAILFDTRSGGVGVLGYYSGADDTVKMFDGTTTLTTAAISFSAYDIITFHFVYGSSGMQIYIDGASEATTASFAFPIQSNVYVGSNSTPSTHSGGAYGHLAIYSVAITAAEVLADYTNIAAIIADGERVGNIPWLVESGASNNYDNYQIFGGIPGDVPAYTEYITQTDLGDTSSIWLSLLDNDYFIHPSKFNIEGPGTAVSIATTSTELESGTIPSYLYDTLKGRDCYIFGYVKTASDTTLTLQLAISNFIGLGSTFRTVPILQYYSYTRTNSLTFPSNYTAEAIESNDITIKFNATAPGGAINAYCDFFQVVPAPVMYYQSRGDAWLNGREITTRGTSYSTLTVTSYSGQHLNLVPGKINTIWSYVNQTQDLLSGNTPIVTSGVITQADVTPRYSLL